MEIMRDSRGRFIKGAIFSSEYKTLMKGHSSHNKGCDIRINIICQECKKQFKHYLSAKRKYCSMGCANKNKVISQEAKMLAWKKNKGKKHSADRIEKNRLGHLGIKKELSSDSLLKIKLRMSGEGNPNWRGGVTNSGKRLRSLREYRIWREAVFGRDDYTCVQCGIKGGYLEADHIKQFALFPELRLDVNNGRTLCLECHKSLDPFRKRLYFVKEKYA